MFLKGLQKIMIPMYNLTKKKKEFSWGEEHQKAFEKIKMCIIKAPVLDMPTKQVHSHCSLTQVRLLVVLHFTMSIKVNIG